MRRCTVAYMCHAFTIHAKWLQECNNFALAQNVIHKIKTIETWLIKYNLFWENPLAYMEKCKQKLLLCTMISVFYFPVLYLVQCIVLLPIWNWRESRKGGFPHSVMLMVSIYASVWANLLLLWWNITSVTVFNPIGPTNVISRCLIILSVGSAQRAFERFGILKTTQRCRTFWMPSLLKMYIHTSELLAIASPIASW